jgi:hypothetical protein
MVTGRQTIGIVITAIVATAVLPPAGAWWLNARRIAVTTDRVRDVVVDVPVADNQVLCGPGRLPDLDVMGADDTHAAWIAAAVSRPEAFRAGMPTDGWGRCFLMNSRWVLSAGPNGVIETALTDDRLAGDDIGVAVK